MDMVNASFTIMMSHTTLLYFTAQKQGIGSYLRNALACHIPNHPKANKQLDVWNGMLKWLTIPCRLEICPVQ